MKKQIIILFLLASSFMSFGQSISLAGDWRFQTDPEDKGITEEWFNKKLNGSIRLPGSMAENGKGDNVTLHTKWTGSIYDSSWFFQPRLAKFRVADNIKIPFWLTPAKHYVGAAWYQKEINIPAGWNRRRSSLLLERVHTISQVWIDGKPVGTQNSLSTSHQYDLGNLLPGKHIITLRIDNRIKDMNVGPDSHSVTDHTQGNWNGVVGKILLQPVGLTEITGIRAEPNMNGKEVLLKIVTNNTDKQVKATFTVSGSSFNTKQPAQIHESYKGRDLAGTTETHLIVILGDQLQPWDEFNPTLYRLKVTVKDQFDNVTEGDVEFGMRQFGIKGTRFTINGRETFLRGTVNNCEFPLTGYPPTDTASWLRIFRIAKAHGLNHMRFHSWCPPEAAFTAADIVGFYLQPEAPTWPNHGTSLGDGRFIDQYIYDETNRMVKEYGNHPSFCMLAAGNEPAGRNQASYLAKFIQYWREKDNRRVYTGASVAMSWPLVPENDYMIKSGTRGLNWNRLPGSDDDYHSALEKFTVPYVTHEMGQWCAFPDFKEINKYTGVYKAKNFELFREDLNDHGMGDMAQKFLMASGKLQELCYKYEIEKSLRTPGLAGFQLLGLQDFPGQGTALVGTINAFWDDKGYSTAASFSRFCNATVPLIRTAKFVYTNNETLNTAVEMYHFGSKPIDNAVLQWKLVDDNGAVIKQSSFPVQTIAIGNGMPVGNISVSLQGFSKAVHVKLVISIDNTAFSNDWDFWVYPAALPAIDRDDIYYTDTLDAKAEEVLSNGGKVFMHAAGKVVKGKEVQQYFTPVFWNTSWFKMRPPHTTGFFCDNKKPAFDNFITSDHSQLQWWEIVNRAQVMHLEDFPKGFMPLLQPIDTWFMNRRLAMLFEASVGKGKLIVCSADLKNNLDKRPVARQLLYSLQQYMMSDKFNPSDKLELSLVRDLFQTPSVFVFNAFTKDSPDELKPQQPAGKKQ
jgi:hypothetical protein